MSPSSLSLETLGSPRILVIGDLMLDEYVWGSVSRLSPEAPVPVLEGRYHEFKSGGAGSVIANLAVLGAEVLACGLIGRDPAGKRLLELLTNVGVNADGIIASEDRQTIRKQRMIASVRHASHAQQQILRVDWEEIRSQTASESQQVGAFLEACFKEPPAAILVSDYEKGLIDASLMQNVIELARSAGVPVLVDPGRTVNYDRYRGATLLCPNRYEAEQASGIALTDAASYVEAGRRLVETLDVEHVALTLDREGIYLVSRQDDGRPTGRAFPTEVRAVTDVAGAGDMVLTLLGMAAASDWSLEDAVTLANIGAGVEVSRVGVTPIERWELEQAIAGGPDPNTSKVINNQDLARVVERARAGGRKVVFANGCFDMLHHGHVVLLERARALGDLLIVGLNSDESIRRLRGADRPILDASARASVMSAISAVDHVVFFEGDSPVDLIHTLQPDVLVKGEDYRDREVLERAAVESYGGTVEFVPMEPVSTTSLLRKFKP